jgi:acetyl-CoA decarbonylase/synthase complex subunit epsilon
MAMAEPWQKAEIPGPLKALVLTKPEVAVVMIKKAKRPILMVGHEAVDIALPSGRPIDFVAQLARAVNIPLVAAAKTSKTLLEIGLKPAAFMGSVDIANRLRDNSWEGLDGQGSYDNLLILGFPYYVAWLVLSGLKHFAPHLTTLSLDRYYQPHATWSFPNTSDEGWEQNLKVIVKNLGGKT